MPRDTTTISSSNESLKRQASYAKMKQDIQFIIAKYLVSSEFIDGDTGNILFVRVPIRINRMELPHFGSDSHANIIKRCLCTIKMHEV